MFIFWLQVAAAAGLVSNVADLEMAALNEIIAWLVKDVDIAPKVAARYANLMLEQEVASISKLKKKLGGSSKWLTDLGVDASDARDICTALNPTPPLAASSSTSAAAAVKAVDSSSVMFSSSRILSSLPANNSATLNSWLCGRIGGKGLQCGLLYRGSRDGFKSGDFHSRCDGVANTLVVCHSTTNFIFGGFTDATWDSKGADISCSSMKSFLFQLSPGMELFEQVKCPESTILGESSHGPIFGGRGGADLLIVSNANTSPDSYSCLGYAYRGNTEGRDTTSLAGSKNFTLLDYEVLHVTRG